MEKLNLMYLCLLFMFISQSLQSNYGKFAANTNDPLKKTANYGGSTGSTDLSNM